MPVFCAHLTSACRTAVVLTVAVWATLPLPARAQEPGDSLPAGPDVFGTGAGFQVVLTNSGFGLGGYGRRSAGPATSLLLELMVIPGKDEREFRFSSVFGSRIPNKANYFLMMPVQAGFQRRLFRNSIEDNFRPYLQLSGGPAFGWEYPYFRDCNGDGLLTNGQFFGDCEERPYDPLGALPRGRFRMGWGGTLAVGAHFGRSRRTAQGIRVGYTANYFHLPIRLLEPDTRDPSQRFFGSPSISVTFGRLF